MEKISEMIDRLCPEGVDIFQLGDVSDIIRGKRVTKGQLLPNGIYPVISGGVTPMGYINEYNREANTITVSQYGTAGYVDFQKEQFWANDICYCVYPTDNLDNRYLWYVLKGKQEVLYAIRNTDATPFSMPIETLKGVEIPLPPLPIQQEIVRILDSFTSMITNLETELGSRQKQYEHYRNKLLTFDENDESVEWKTLGEIGTIVRGNGLQKTDFSEEGVGCVHYGQIYTRLGFSIDKTLTFVPEELAEKLTQVEPGNLIIACTSENVEDVCKSVVWLGSENVVTGGHACVFKHNENPKYVGYCFMTNDFFNQKKKYAYGAKVIDIKTEKLALIKIPVPKRSLQDDVVEKLDTFESLITNIKQELEARKKQYEYYREQLLTFE